MTTNIASAPARTLSKHRRVSATDAHRIAALVDRWWLATDQGKPDVAASAEARLHDLLAARFIGVTFSCSTGILIRVDAHTPRGVVIFDEAYPIG